MHSFPKLSIVTITYNAEAYIERTLISVTEQDYPNIEYIIIDGKSTDETNNIIAKYKAKIDKIIVEKDEGIYDAMNKGLDLLTGDYVVFMNAGDVMVDKFALSSIMKGAENADFIYSKAEYIDESGYRRPWHKETPSAQEINPKSFLNGMVVCHQCMLIKTSIAPKFKLNPWKISADLDWTIRVMKQVKTAHFYDATFVYYLDGGFSGKQKKQSVEERFDICKKHFGFWTTFFHQFKIALGVAKRGRLS